MDLIPEDDCINEDGGDSNQDVMDNVSVLSLGVEKQAGVFETTSVNQGPPVEVWAPKPQLGDNARYQLIADAILQRQKWYRLRQLHEVDGISWELMMHHLDCHSHRQHHTFPITYRPAIM